MGHILGYTTQVQKQNKQTTKKKTADFLFTD